MSDEKKPMGRWERFSMAVFAACFTVGLIGLVMMGAQWIAQHGGTFEKVLVGVMAVAVAAAVYDEAA